MKKLISWNVNGLRACVGKGFMDFFNEADADVFCIQESKLQEGQIDLDLPGYYQYWNYAEKKGYSGTAMFTKEEPISVSYGLGIEEHDHEGRVITAEFPEYYIVTCYTPNSKDGLARIQQDVLERKPDFCCVMFGTNDVTNAYKCRKHIHTDCRPFVCLNIIVYTAWEHSQTVSHKFVYCRNPKSGKYDRCF